MLDLMVDGNASSVALHVPASVVPNTMIKAFEIFSHLIYGLRYENFRFTAAILDFRLNGTSNKVGFDTIEKFDTENTEITASILFLSAPKLEIHPWEKYFILDIRRIT
jgi:hypothetical protein